MLKLKKETESLGQRKQQFFLIGNKNDVRQKLCLLKLFAINYIVT